MVKNTFVPNPAANIFHCLRISISIYAIKALTSYTPLGRHAPACACLCDRIFTLLNNKIILLIPDFLLKNNKKYLFY